MSRGFRVWDKENEEYMNGYDVLLKYDGSVISRYALVTFDTDMPVNVIIEQYTGLKDKNGEKIYEGDIVKCEGSGAVIIWREKNAELGIRWLDCGVEDELDYWNDIRGPVEVIGNIHENPELLGVKE